MYVERVKKRQGAKVYRSVLVRESYREGGKVRHRTVANVSGLPARMVAELERSLAGRKSGIGMDEVELANSREYGASRALLELARELGLDTLLYSRREPWREDAMAMIVGRIVFQGSKLHLSHLGPVTALWELCGHEAGAAVPVERHCYWPMDRLLERQEAIQKQLARRHLTDGCLILYDMTNMWFDGEYGQSQLVDYGMGKGGKRGYKQVAIGLVAGKDGVPVAVEVFNGRTSDQATVEEQARRLAETYGVKEIIFAGDRGMLTPKRIGEVSRFGFRTLTAMTHPQVAELLSRHVIQPELFDERHVAEVVDPDGGGVRYMLCKNPETLMRERLARAGMIGAVSTELAKMAAVRRRRRKEDVCARVGKLFAKYRIQKFYAWSVSGDGALAWSLDAGRVEAEAALDGCYVIRTDAPAGTLTSAEAVAGYKALAGVEKAFRNLKTVSLEIRPVYHKLDRRIKAHVFLCMLAYYLQWNAEQRLCPLREADGEGADRRWSFDRILEELKAVRIEDCMLKGVKVGTKVTSPNESQKKIMELLGTRRA